jgi:hypothetical protein
MKVTSNIREYITAEVTKILDAQVNPYAVQAKLDRKMMDDFLDELRAIQNDMIKNFVSENEIVDTWMGRNTPYTACANTPSFGHAATPAILKSKAWEEEHARYKTSKTREIIAKLELGANRQELEEMLNGLKEDFYA